MPVVLYGCGTFILQANRTENRILRQIYDPKKDEKWGVEKASH